ncbi:DgyrCDS4790 [Dimorphilus gyrociliatus]|uniref:sphingomyelin phosphodiesterase n=1 Tax=Dimorphilus gyrociliatus TaxID=2664684 RepID=A0A7I8VJF3_9ANNE|nr:DgyrCDS4790 [Dimorphilus gyrociliatus]
MKIGFFLVTLFCISNACEDTGCPDGQSCNPYTDQCVVDPPPPARPAAWIGDDPDFCNRKPDDCKLFAMEYDISHPKGDGEFCENGTKIRCILPEHKPQLQATPENEFRTISYNLMERSFQITWDGQRERTCRVVLWLLENHRDVDAITFQEAFMGGCFYESLTLRDMLEYYDFKYHTKTVDSEDKVSNGGIFVSSKWPIVEEDMHVYNLSHPDTWDWFAAKGVSYAKIQKGNTFYHVTSTHMQAGGSSAIKPIQCKEAADFLKTKAISQSEAIIYTGDFNLNQWSESGMGYMRQCLSNLDSEIPPYQGSRNITVDPENDLNQLTGGGGSGVWIDYVLPNIVHKRPVSAVQVALKPVDPASFPVCWCEQCIPLDPSYIFPDDEDCDRVERLRDLSDHYPVLGIFKY